MTNYEIYESYRNAANKDKQLSILADLNDCSTNYVKAILVGYGYQFDTIPEKCAKSTLDPYYDEIVTMSDEEWSLAMVTKELLKKPEFLDIPYATMRSRVYSYVRKKNISLLSARPNKFDKDECENIIKLGALNGSSIDEMVYEILELDSTVASPVTIRQFVLRYIRENNLRNLVRYGAHTIDWSLCNTMLDEIKKEGSYGRIADVTKRIRKKPEYKDVSYTTVYGYVRRQMQRKKMI